MKAPRKIPSFQVILICTLLFLIFYLLEYCLPRESGGNQTDNALESFHRLCLSPCLFTDDSPTMQAEIIFTSFKGIGRTGNYIRSMRRAIHLAFLCKRSIELPAMDDASGALPINESFSNLNFSGRKGRAHAACINFSFPMTGNAVFFWNLDEYGSMFKANSTDDEIISQIPTVNNCIRSYLGICNPGYCLSEWEENSGALVAHVREGDVFQEGHKSVDAPCYGQPPVSYYIRAMLHETWNKVIFVGEPGPFGPFRSAITMLNSTGIFHGLKIQLQASNVWSNDLRTLMCSQYLVTSRSSLIPALSFGFSKRIYSYSCASQTSEIQQFVIPVRDYPHWDDHSGNTQEWVNVLLHDAGRPQACATYKFLPKEPDSCLPLWLDTFLPPVR